MLAGFADVDITPSVGSTLGGFIARTSPSTGVDVPLKARALYLRANGTEALLIGLDVLGLSPDYADRLVLELAGQFKLREEQVLLACSHTHSGPLTVFMRGIGPADSAYLELLANRVRQAAGGAIEDAAPVQLSWGTAPLAIGVNRRQVVNAPEGRGVVLGVNPDGPADRLVRVLRLSGEGRSILLLQHTCHPYCLGGDSTWISADFWGHAAGLLAEEGHRCVYLNGCAGNIAAVQGFGGLNAARSTGLQVADAVLKAVNDAQPADSDVLCVAAQRFELPLDEAPDLAGVRADLNRPDRTVRGAERGNPVVQQRVRQAWREWFTQLEATLTNGSALPALPARISIFRVGGGGIVALPGEVFYEIGEAIAAHLPARPVWVAGYTHGYIGYLPTPESYPLGGYEVDEAHRYMGLWRVSPRASEIIADQVTGLWARMRG